MPTIKDVARLAGVSHGTVSNVLRGAKNVKLENVLKVKEAMNGYAAEYKPYMPLYYQRFGDTSEYWDHYIDGIGTFFENRAEHILPFVKR